jgi:hypothetical protein
MGQAALYLGNRKMEGNYKQKAEDIIKDFTHHDHARVVNSGNSAIMVAMSTMKGPVLIPDQGGWSGFQRIAEFLGLEIIYLPTKQGIIDLELLENSIKNMSPESLFITSFAGYMAEQPVKEIYEVCEERGVILVEDSSGSIGDRQNNLACGDHAHIIVASTGSPKIVNLGNGGFISTNDPEIFKNSNYLLKSFRTSPVICAGMVEAIKKAPESLSKTINSCRFLKKKIKPVLYDEYRGINVTIPTDNPKQIASKLRKIIPVEGGGIISTCPRYDRINQPAVCLEIKNLEIKCLKHENLREITDITNKIISNDFI